MQRYASLTIIKGREEGSLDHTQEQSISAIAAYLYVHLYTFIISLVLVEESGSKVLGPRDHWSSA